MFNPKFRNRGRGVRRLPGQMNGLEHKYSQHLEGLKVLGQIEHWIFDAVKLRLADNTFYTPDFLVMLPDGLIEFHEVKGHWEDDARVKIKVAASIHPFTFIAIQAKAKKHGGGWSIEQF